MPTSWIASGTDTIGRRGACAAALANLMMRPDSAGIGAHRVGNLVDAGAVFAAQLDDGERDARRRGQLAGGLELVEAEDWR